MKKVEKSSSAGTTAEQSTEADVSSVSQPIAKPPVIGRALKDVVHFYIGNDVRMFNTVTNEWSNWRKMSFVDANMIVNHEAKAQLKLRDILDVDFDEYAEVDKKYGNEDIGQTASGFISKPNYVRRFHLTTYAERTLEAAKRGYDIFGLLGTEYAVIA